MKTKELKILFYELSNLNNSLTHYLFVWEQFNIEYSQLIEENKDKLTSKIFEKNILSNKHNIELSKLELEHFKTNNNLLCGIYVLIYSHFENYLKEIFELGKKLNSQKVYELNEGTFKDDEILLKKILNRLNIELNSIEQEVFTTFDYLRFKRNRLVHSKSKNISKPFKEIIKYHGLTLNKYWEEKLQRNLQDLDFSNYENSDNLNYNILIETINIYRNISNHFDELILKIIDVDKFITEEILREFKVMNNLKKINFSNEKNRKKFTGFARTNYCLDAKFIDFEKMI